MNTWGRSREVEKVKPRQQVSIAELPQDQQDAAMAQVDAVRARVEPQLITGTDYSLHTFGMDGAWQVWLNNEDHTFSGLCLAVGDSREEAVADAKRTLAAAAEQIA